MNPPVLSRERALEWHKEAVRARRDLDTIASRIGVYAAGGIPAHKIREANQKLSEAAQAILDAALPDDPPSVSEAGER